MPYTFIIPPTTKLGGYTGITLSVRPSVCRRARLGKIARLGIGCHGGYFVPLGQPHSSFDYIYNDILFRSLNHAKIFDSFPDEP